MTVTELTGKIRELKELQALIDEATAEIEAIKDEVKALMTSEGKDEMTVDVYKVRYTAVKSNRFDTASFKKTHADLYEQYTKQTEIKRFNIA